MRNTDADNGELKSGLSLVISIILIYSVFTVTGIGCPIKFLTGVSCAGCGMTRATVALLEGRYRAAFHYHPLVLLPYIALILYLFRKRFSERIRRSMLIAIVVLFLDVYLYRLLYADQDIVVFEPEKGAVFRILSYFFTLFTK